MLKKFIFSLLLLFPVTIFASSNAAFRVGNNFYDNLSDAIQNASSTDVIELFSDATLDNTLTINKTVNIDLNGHNIVAPSTVFLVQSGTLNLNGEGTIKETEPNYGAIRVIGSTTDTNNKYSTVTVGKNVTLEGWAGLFITHTSGKSYGVSVNLDGKINAVSDINGSKGAGIYVNGSIKHEDNAPVINISDDAQITSNGTGLYIAGYTIVNIGKSNIRGTQSGLGIKSGVLNIDGATIVCDGEDYTPTEGYNNGMKASGTTIQIESNNGYAGNVELNISNGNFTSKNSHVIYEYIGKGNNTLVKSMSISGGTFVSEASKEVFLLSNSLKTTHPHFISGGKYSSNPSSYLKTGYSSNSDGKYYNVSKSAMKEVFLETTGNNSSNLFRNIMIIITPIILGIAIYFNRLKITKLFNRYILKR